MLEPGNLVRILRTNCYWANNMGTVVSIDSGDTIYPVMVRFERSNYQGFNSSYFGFHELELLGDDGRLLDEEY